MNEELRDDIKISDDVVASIVGFATTEVDGVSSIEGNITNEIVGKLGIRNSLKGIKVVIDNNVVSSDLYLNIRYGYSIPKVSAEVQDKVKNAIESMTGLTAAVINIHVVGIDVK